MNSHPVYVLVGDWEMSPPGYEDWAIGGAQRLAAHVALCRPVATIPVTLLQYRWAARATNQDPYLPDSMAQIEAALFIRAPKRQRA